MVSVPVDPNSEVWLYSGISLDKSYNHTLLNRGGNVASQKAKFDASDGLIRKYLKYHLTSNTFQRAGKNKIRVRLNVQQIIDCNYMIFSNTRNVGTIANPNNITKYYFAFVDSAEYINENTTEVSYTIDVMQTYYFDYDLGYCYVAREHTEFDDIGENLVPENIGTEDLMIQSELKLGGDVNTVIVYYVPNNFDDDGETYYVIIDDEYVILNSQLPHFILTNPYEGITEEQANKAISILNG